MKASNKMKKTKKKNNQRWQMDFLSRDRSEHKLVPFKQCTAIELQARSIRTNEC